jgi:hypothetical protein
VAIAAVCDIVGAFLWGDEGDSIGDCREQVIESSRGRLPEQRLELGKELLDRIEIWAVRREIADVAPAAAIASRIPLTLWLGRLSMMTMSPGDKLGARNCST